MKYALGEQVVVCRGRHYIAPGAVLIGSVELGDNCSVWFNAVIRADNDQIVIGEGSNVQDGSLLHVDPGFPMSIGRDVTIGHKVILHGCSVGDESLIGMNAVVLNGARVGNNCLVGANSLVTEGTVIPDGSLFLGSPGKVVKSLDEKAFEMLRHAALSYQEKIPRYTESLKPC